MLLLSAVKNITSAGNTFFLYYYSYIKYASTAWERSKFEAKVEITDCKGFFQVSIKTGDIFPHTRWC